MKPKSYLLDDKIWFNSKYIKTKQDCKLEAKFFDSFQVLQLTGKQIYKLEFPKTWKIYDIIHLSLLEKNTNKKGRIDETTSQLNLDKGVDGEKYKVERLCDSVVYVKKSECGHLLDLYYIVLWKSYPEEENI